jgi:hypothetical protein
MNVLVQTTSLPPNDLLIQASLSFDACVLQLLRYMHLSLSAIVSLWLHYTHLMFIHSDSLSRHFYPLLRL